MAEESNNYLARLYRGDIPLVITFWVFHVLTGLGMLGILAVATIIIIHKELFSIYSALILLVAPMLVLFLYYPLSSIALYNSAKKYQGNPIWQKLAMAISVLTIIAVAYFMVLQLDRINNISSDDTIATHSDRELASYF